MPSGGGIALGERIWGDGIESLHAVGATGRSSRGETPTVARVFEPSPLLQGNARAAIELRLFAEAAGVQREVAAASDRWARVDHVSLTEGRVVVHRDHSLVSVQSLIDRGVRVDAAGLRTLVEQVLLGVEAFHAVAARPVGVLHPRQVLLDRLDDLTEARVTLTDPSPTASGDPVTTDLRAAARLIEQVVERRPAWAAARWPLQMTEAWKRLGRSGEAWLNTVNRWLDPGAGREPVTIRQAIESLPIEPRSLRKPVLAGGGLAATIGVGLLVYFQFFHVATISEAQVEPLRRDLMTLSEACEDWFTDFEARLLVERRVGRDPFQTARTSESMRAVLDDLNGILDRFGSAAAAEQVQFDPRRYFGLRPNPGEPRREGEPTSVPRLLDDVENRDVIESQRNFQFYILKPELRLRWFSEAENARVQRAVVLLDSLKQSLRESALATECSNAADQLAGIGLDGPARELRALLVGLQDEEPKGLAEMVVQLAGVRSAHESTFALLDAISRIEAVASQRPSPAPGAFVRWSRGRLTGASSLESLARQAADLLPLARRIDDVSSIDESGLRWDLLVAEHPVDPSQLNDAATFESWAESARGYRIIAPDPRLARAEAATTTGKVDELLGEVNEFLHGRRLPEVDDLARRRAEVTAALTALHERPLIERDRQDIVASDQRVRTELARLLNDTEAVHRIVLQPPAEFLERKRAVRFASASAQRAWDEYFARAGDAGQYEADRSKYLAFNGATLDFESALSDLVLNRLKLEPSVREILDAAPEPNLARRHAEDRREQGVAVVVQSLNRLAAPGGSGASLEHETVRSALQREEQSFAAWQQSVTGLFADLDRLRRLLDLAYLPDEPDENQGTIRTMLAAWRRPASMDAASLDGFADVFSGLLTRISDLERVSTLDDLQSVSAYGSAAEHADRIEITRAVWERLGELPIAGDADSLRLHAEALERYEALLSRLDEADRARRLSDRLRGQAPNRWLNHLATRVSAVEIEAMLREMGRFHARREQMPPWVGWNLDLMAFRQRIDQGGASQDDELTTPLIRQFLTDMGAMDATVRSTQQVASFLTELNDMLAPENTRVDFTRIGPSASPDERVAQGWRLVQEGPRQGNAPPPWVHYATAGERPIHLIFRLVDPSRAPDLKELGFKSPVYLSTTEVSFNLFADTINRARGLQGVAEHLVDVGAQVDRRYGPRVWQYRRNPPGLISPPLPLRQGERPAWRADTDQWRNADNVRLDINTDIDSRLPDRNYPMQHLSPTAAAYAASLLGCRLPTNLEFQAAIRQSYSNPFITDWDRLKGEIQRGALTPAPNLRDTRFERQRAHMVEVAAQLNQTLITPDRGSFNNPSRSSSADADSHLTGYDDGVLYFTEIPGDPVMNFEHLLGNVMEWTYDDPLVFREGRDRRILTPADADTALRADLLGVMGGSSMSPPSLDPLVRQRVDPRTFGGQLKFMRLADVGFRLVLEPRGRFTTLAEWVLETSTAAFDTPARRALGAP